MRYTECCLDFCTGQQLRTRSLQPRGADQGLECPNFTHTPQGDQSSSVYGFFSLLLATTSRPVDYVGYNRLEEWTGSFWWCISFSRMLVKLTSFSLNILQHRQHHIFGHSGESSSKQSAEPHKLL